MGCMMFGRKAKTPTYFCSEYRDPLPGEDVPDDPMLQFLAPERQRFWRQVRDEQYAGRASTTARLENYSRQILRDEVLGAMIFRFAAAVDAFEKHQAA